MSKSEADKWCDQRDAMFNSWEKKNIYRIIDGLINKLAEKYEVPKSSIYMKQGFNSLLFYSDCMTNESNPDQLIETIKKLS